jgi:hypothetical protein
MGVAMTRRQGISLCMKYGSGMQARGGINLALPLHTLNATPYQVNSLARGQGSRLDMSTTHAALNFTWKQEEIGIKE